MSFFHYKSVSDSILEMHVMLGRSGSYNDVLNKPSMASGMDDLPIKPLNMTQLVNILQNIYRP
jgi:hypothetical protein